MRFATLLLAVLCVAPGLAIRGERRTVRDLRGDQEQEIFETREDRKGESKEPVGEDKEPKNIADKKDKDPDPKDPKDPKDDKDPKDKKDKKCKKAKKAKKDKKDKDQNLVRRYAEVIQEDDVKFCLHSAELSEDQCDKVKKGAKLPKDGSVKGGLDIELVHSEEQSSTQILQTVDSILSSDTNPRFVGCESLDASPPPKSPKIRHSRARRFLEEYVTVAKEEDKVDVTGVEFDNLDIFSGGEC